MNTASPKIDHIAEILAGYVEPIAYPEDPFSLVDTYMFWTRQVLEHALFISLALSKEELARNGLPDYKQKGKSLFLKGQEILKKGTDTNVLFAWLNEVEVYLGELLPHVQKHWIGYIVPSLLEHYLLELRYFRRKMTDLLNNTKTISQEEELSMALKLSEDHAATIARLLDPKETVLFKDLNLLSDYFKELRLSPDYDGELESLIMLTQQANNQLNSIFNNIRLGLINDQLLSMIHPALISHIIREGERANLALMRLSEGLPV